MGSEDLFHKRKARTRAQNQRKAASRKPYDRVLIVCEGEKTEPIYFEEARLAWEIDSANIVIDGDCDTSPIGIVEHAKRLFDAQLRANNGYDSVFCIFDRDSHSSFDEAFIRVAPLTKSC